MGLFESIREVIHTILKAFRCANSYNAYITLVGHFSPIVHLPRITITGVHCIILCEHRYVRYINYA